MFKKRFGRTPNEFIQAKLANGTSMDAVQYELNIILAEVSRQYNCVFFDFNYFYKPIVLNNPQPEVNSFQKVKRPENAGKAWSTEEEQQLIKMYNSGCSKKEMCDTFKRTEVALAARLVRLGIIENRDVFRNRK